MEKYISFQGKTIKGVLVGSLNDHDPHDVRVVVDIQKGYTINAIPEALKVYWLVGDSKKNPNSTMKNKIRDFLAAVAHFNALGNRRASSHVRIVTALINRYLEDKFDNRVSPGILEVLQAKLYQSDLLPVAADDDPQTPTLQVASERLINDLLDEHRTHAAYNDATLKKSENTLLGADDRAQINEAVRKACDKYNTASAAVRESSLVFAMAEVKARVVLDPWTRSPLEYDTWEPPKLAERKPSNRTPKRPQPFQPNTTFDQIPKRHQEVVYKAHEVAEPESAPPLQAGAHFESPPALERSVFDAFPAPFEDPLPAPPPRPPAASSVPTPDPTLVFPPLPEPESRDQMIAAAVQAALQAVSRTLPEDQKKYVRAEPKREASAKPTFNITPPESLVGIRDPLSTFLRYVAGCSGMTMAELYVQEPSLNLITATSFRIDEYLECLSERAGFAYTTLDHYVRESSEGRLTMEHVVRSGRLGFLWPAASRLMRVYLSARSGLFKGATGNQIAVANGTQKAAMEALKRAIVKHLRG